MQIEVQPPANHALEPVRPLHVAEPLVRRKVGGRILYRASHKRAGSIALRTTQAQVLLTSYFSFHGAANMGQVSI